MFAQGHRTYTSFLHFLLCTTLFAFYIACVCVSAVFYAFSNPLSIVSNYGYTPSRVAKSFFQDDKTPLHEISLALAGIVITMVIGPFLAYHVYLTS